MAIRGVKSVGRSTTTAAFGTDSRVAYDGCFLSIYCFVPIKTSFDACDFTTPFILDSVYAIFSDFRFFMSIYCCYFLTLF